MATREENLETIKRFCLNRPGYMDDACASCPLTNDCERNNWHEATNETLEEMANKVKAAQDVTDALLKKTVYLPKNPAHYGDAKNPWECGDAMIQAFGEEAFLNFCLCNALKYIWRARSKGGNDDIRKAITYLEKFLEVEEKNNV